MKAYLSSDFFEFFKKLAANNHKGWFDENRNWYENDVKKPFEQLVDALLAEEVKRDKTFANILAKDCIFRINKDVRFSKDKTPYKLNRSAVVSAMGKKETLADGFYFEVGPEVCSIYAGVYMAEKNELQNIRNYIAKNAATFNKIIAEKEFVKTFDTVQGSKQKRLDSSLREAAEKQPLLYNTQFYIRHDFAEKIAKSTHLVPYLLGVSETARVFTDFMKKAVK